MDENKDNLEETKKEVTDDVKAEVIESKNDEEKTDNKPEKKKDSVEESSKKVKTNIESKEEEKKFINKYNSMEYIENKKKKNHKFIVLGVITALILLVIAVLCTIFAIINSGNDKILGGISIENMSVEGMTEKEATDFLNENMNNEKTKEITLIINGETFTITQEQFDVNYNVEEAVDKAFKIGRDGNIFQNNFRIIRTFFDEDNIELNYTYNEELLDKLLVEMEARLPNVMIDNSYEVDEDENVLIISRGTAGVVIDKVDAKDKIIKSIDNMNNEPIEVKTINMECPEINIEKIHEEVKREPQNASYIKEPFQIIPHKVGLDFDVEEAMQKIQEEKEEYRIKLTVIEPEVHTSEIGDEAFPDLLGSFSTKYDASNRPRSNNLMIAMKKLDGTVVMPGEVFSYNKTLGKRTVEDGYEYANGFSGGGVVPMLAGGICQISSTLYDAVLYANLNIVERHNHMFQAQYVAPGKDATVVYGSLDFKFENTRKYPIIIRTQCGSGIADIKIFGIKEEVEYEVEILSQVQSYTSYKVVYQNDSSLAPGVEKVSQNGIQGCKSITYRILRLNGQEVSREVLSTDVYDPMNKIVKRGVGGSTTKTTEPEQTVAPQPQSEPEIITQKEEDKEEDKKENKNDEAATGNDTDKTNQTDQISNVTPNP